MMMRRRYSQKIHVFPQWLWVYDIDLWMSFMVRRSGEALCHFCRKPYNAHPNHPALAEQIPTLVVACDGTPVKT